LLNVNQLYMIPMLIPVFTCDCMYVPHGSMIFWL